MDVTIEDLIISYFIPGVPGDDSSVRYTAFVFFFPKQGAEAIDYCWRLQVLPITHDESFRGYLHITTLWSVNKKTSILYTKTD